MARSKPIAAADFETDPFLYGRVPEPFCCGYYNGTEYHEFWGEGCAEQFAEFVSDRKEVVYFHNGGRFDFFFLLPWAEPDLKIINGRIAKMKIGECELRDSYLILPLPLSAYQKDAIDYGIMEKDKRNVYENKRKIIDYLHSDCVYLYDWVTKFTERFGRKLTLASAAFEQLKQTNYEIGKSSEHFDEELREYYYGGRTQAFNKGHFEGDFVYVDINSAYPFAMMQPHPWGTDRLKLSRLPTSDECENGGYFATIKAVSRGALPFRSEEGLQFPDDNEPRIYKVSGWEIMAGLGTGTLDILDVIECTVFEDMEDFAPYVEKFYEEKATCKSIGDKTGELFAKLMLNSAYGRFAMNSRNFKDYCITEMGDTPPDRDGNDLCGWEIYCDTETDQTIWQREARGGYFYNVATAASITGFVRAYLWRAICASKNPLYCDTDSIICGEFHGEIGNELGQWDLEAEFDEVNIAGKKLYACHLKPGYFNAKAEYPEWKKASKGSRLPPEDIKRIAKDGVSIVWENHAPSFSVKYGARFIDRKIKQT